VVERLSGKGKRGFRILSTSQLLNLSTRKTFQPIKKPGGENESSSRVEVIC
jgi:hypothetical protein